MNSVPSRPPSALQRLPTEAEVRVGETEAPFPGRGLSGQDTQSSNGGMLSDSPTRMRTQTKRAMSAPGLREAATTKAVVLQDWMVPELSQPQMRMVRVPVLLSVGGPLSTTRMGRRNTSCSCRLKPTCWVCTAAVLSARKKSAVCDSGLGQTPGQPHPDATSRSAASHPKLPPLQGPTRLSL